MSTEELTDLHAKLEALAKESTARMNRVQGTGRSLYGELFRSALPDTNNEHEQHLYMAAAVRARSGPLRAQNNSSASRVRSRLEYLVDLAASKPFTIVAPPKPPQAVEIPAPAAEEDVTNPAAEHPAMPSNHGDQPRPQVTPHQPSVKVSNHGGWTWVPQPSRLAAMNVVPILRHRGVDAAFNTELGRAVRSSIAHESAATHDGQQDIEGYRIAHGRTGAATTGGPTIRNTFAPESALGGPNSGGGAAHHPKKRSKSTSGQPRASILRSADAIWNALEAADEPDRLETYAFEVQPQPAAKKLEPHSSSGNSRPVSAARAVVTPAATAATTLSSGRSAGGGVGRPLSARPTTWRVIPWASQQPLRKAFAPLAVRGEKVEVPLQTAVPITTAKSIQKPTRPTTAPVLRRPGTAPSKRPTSAAVKRPMTAVRSRGGAPAAFAFDDDEDGGLDVDDMSALGQVIRDNTAPSP